MEIIFFAIVLVIVGTAISVTGALRRIADATEKTAMDVETLLSEFRRADQRP
ncbi:hypothetical protein [Mycetocola zhujimingii]|uniref:hypothetical protein n=1 Tax=Mycetocola zhujimingii TaxID=2079792 RepID=UPI001304D693|nr:hypothetical protein [Mycetocola zhujimingii]